MTSGPGAIHPAERVVRREDGRGPFASRRCPHHLSRRPPGTRRHGRWAVANRTAVGSPSRCSATRFTISKGG